MWRLNLRCSISMIISWKLTTQRVTEQHQLSDEQGGMANDKDVLIITLINRHRRCQGGRCQGPIHSELMGGNISDINTILIKLGVGANLAADWALERWKCSVANCCSGGKIVYMRCTDWSVIKNLWAC